MTNSSLLFISSTLLSLTPSLALAETLHENTIEKIMVTGQKIERSLENTKESVVVFTEQQLAEMPVSSYQDIFNLSANTTAPGNGEIFGLRGVTQNSSATGGGSGELGSLYIDGVAYTGFATRFNAKDLWDINQIEILRGPQSTNVGRNALIGAVVVQSNRPEIGENLGAFRLEAGNYGHYGFSTMTNLAVSERSAFRFSSQFSASDGIIYNQIQDDDRFDARENIHLRGQYFVDFSDNLQVNLLSSYVETERGQDLYRSDLVANDSFTSSANLPANEDYDAYSLALQIDYRFYKAWQLSATTSFLKGDYQRFDDDDEGPEGGLAFRGREATDRNGAQELRLTHTASHYAGVIGFYYTDVDLINNTTGLINILPSNLGIPSELLSFYPDAIAIDRFTPFRQQTENKAFFTEWDYYLNEAITLSFGLRYDDEKQQVLSNMANSLSATTPLPDPESAAQIADNLSPGLGPVVRAGITQINTALLAQIVPTQFPEETFHFDTFLPQFGLTYEVNDQVTLSTFYKQGYRAGGVEVNALGDRSDYQPEYLDNYELALRSNWFEKQLRINANLYYGDWTDQQVTLCANDNIFNCRIDNAGESEIYGFELETQYDVFSDLNLFANIGYAQNEFTDYVSAEGDLSGNDFAFSPDWTAALGGRFYLNNQFYLSANINYQSSQWADQQNTLALDSRVLINTKIGYEKEAYTITAYVTNLTDHFYRTINSRGIGGSSLISGGAPRQFGITIDYRFE